MKEEGREEEGEREKRRSNLTDDDGRVSVNIEKSCLRAWKCKRMVESRVYEKTRGSE